MNEDKTGLKITLGILGLLAVIAAVWRVVAYEPSTSVVYPAQGVKTQAQGIGGANTAGNVQASPQAILDEFLPETAPAVPALQSVPMRTQVAQPYPQNRASHKQAYPYRPIAKGQGYVDTNFYSQPPVSAVNQGVNISQAPVVSRAYGNITSPLASPMQTRVQEERAQMLAPYLRPNRKQKEQMDARWAKLSAAIDRAVAQALLPKSKQAQAGNTAAVSAGITEQGAGLTGPYSPVAQAVSAQKNEIVKSFGSAFGGQAAQQVGSLMDQYAQELATALNLPGASAEQKEAKIKEISKKYQKEMDKLAEKNQYDKFVAQRIAKDNQQKADLRAQYPDPDLNAQFNQIIDEAREKDLALATQQLPAEEYYKAVYANQYEMHTRLEEAVRKAGQSLSALHQWDSKQAQQELETLRKQEEEGKIMSVATKSVPAEVAGLEKTLTDESDKMLQHFTQAYGEQKAQEVKQILDNYHTKMIETTQQVFSPAERAQHQHDLWAESNRQILQWQMGQIEQMNIPDEQKQATLEKLRHDYNNIK